MKKRYLTVALLSAACMSASAQTASAFFTDGFLLRHEMNPAMSNDESYFSMPLLGSVNFGLRGDIGMGDLLYSSAGKTVTFMHPSVSSAEALKPFSDQNRMVGDLRYSIFSLGKRNYNSYVTVDLSLRSNFGLSLPGDLFRIAKEGPANQAYNLSGIELHGSAWAELAIGYSRHINSKLDIGVKAKALIGLAKADMHVNKATLNLSDDHWNASVDAEVEASMSGLQFTSDEYGTTIGKPIDNIDVDSPGIGGFGMAFDLGATYKITDDWQVGLALLDLGMISWKNNMVASTDGTNTFDTNNYLFSLDDDADNSFSDELDRLSDDLTDLFNLKNMGDKGSSVKGLGATLNASGQYTLPAYRKFTAGLLLSSHFGDNSWTEARLSANLAPVKWFSMSVSGAVGTFGPSFGWVLNLHPNGFNIYAAMDCMGTPFSSEGIPCGNQAHFNVGLCFPVK